MLISVRTHEALKGDYNKVKEHLDAATLHHVKATNQLKEGNYEEAAQNAILAKRYLDLASEVMRGQKQYPIEEYESM